MFKVFVNLPGESLVIRGKTGIIRMVLFTIPEKCFGKETVF